MLIDIAKAYFKQDFSDLLHPFYRQSVEMAERLQVHSRGLTPTKMLKMSRPNEKPEYIAYREEVYRPITKTYYEKVIAQFLKAPQAEDWKISYPDSKPLVSSNSLEDYMENSYPEFDSYTNYFFSYLARLYGDDPNGCIATFPLNLDAPDNELRRPFAFSFEARQVLEFVDRKYCVLLDDEKSMVGRGTEQVAEGNIFHLLDESQYIRCTQVGTQESYSFDVLIINHNGGYLPARKLGRKIKERKSGRTLYESDLAACLPFWDEVVSDFSDHQINKKLHLHPDRWEMATSECRTCKGKGKVTVRNPTRLNPQAQHEEACSVCDGHGAVVAKSPFNTIIIKPVTPTGLNDAVQNPTPPAGYITRPIESIDFLRTEWKDNLRLGLAALNMEHLFEEPVVNSGVAKTVDKQENKSFILEVYRHFVQNGLEADYEFHNNWRYGFQAEAVRYRNLPVINTPQKIDLLTVGLLSDRLASARTNKYSPEIIAGLELHLSVLEFGKDSLVVRKLELKHRLDPLPYLTPAEKNESIINSSLPATSYQNYVISSNLDSFITRALEEDKNFEKLTYAEQVTVMKRYADEISQANKANLVITEPDEDAARQTGNDNPPVRQAG